MPVSEALIARQLDELRKEHASVLAAVQQKTNEVISLTDKLHRQEVYAKSVLNELH